MFAIVENVTDLRNFGHSCRHTRKPSPSWELVRKWLPTGCTYCGWRCNRQHDTVKKCSSISRREVLQGVLRTRYIDQDRAILKYRLFSRGAWFGNRAYFRSLERPRDRDQMLVFLLYWAVVALLSCSKFICAILEKIRALTVIRFTTSLESLESLSKRFRKLHLRVKVIFTAFK